MAHANSAVRGRNSAVRFAVRFVIRGRIKEKDEANFKREFEKLSPNASDYTTSD